MSSPEVVLEENFDQEGELLASKYFGLNTVKMQVGGLNEAKWYHSSCKMLINYCWN